MQLLNKNCCWLVGILILLEMVFQTIYIKNINIIHFMDIGVIYICFNIIWYLGMRNKSGFVAKSLYNEINIKVIRRGTLIVILLLIIYISLMNLFITMPFMNKEVLLFQRTQSNERFIMYISETVILAPIIEEILFRGFLYNKLRKYFKVEYAILLQAIIFGLVHINKVNEGIVILNIFHVLVTVTSGILFGYVAYRSKSLWNSIALHMAWNLFLSIIVEIVCWEKFNMYINIIVVSIATTSLIFMLKKFGFLKR